MIVDKKYNITFEEDNSNALRITDAINGKLISMISCPPTKYSTDIIDVDCTNNVRGYGYNFTGLVLISNPKERIVYYKGREICKTSIIKSGGKNFVIVDDEVHYQD